MKRIQQNFVSAAVVIASAFSAAGVVDAQNQAADPAAAQPVVLQRVLVKVNGAIFTKTDLEERQIDVLRDRNQQTLSQLDLQTDAKLRAMLIEITPQILSAAIDELILVQRGRELGARLSEEQYKSFIERIMKENGIRDQDTLIIELAKQGMTLAQFRGNIERSYLKDAALQKEIGRRLTLTEEEARQYYRANPDEFMKPSLVTLREIFVAVPTEVRGGEEVFNQAVDEAALARVQAAHDRAVKGEDFATLVAEISESGSRANGGLVGPINLNELAEVLRAYLDPLKQGEMARPIRTAKGYQLFKIETRTPAEVEAYELVRNQIAEKVYSARHEAETRKHLDSLRTQAIIEWKDDELKKMYEQYIAQQKKTF